MAANANSSYQVKTNMRARVGSRRICLVSDDDDDDDELPVLEGITKSDMYLPGDPC